MVKLLTKLKKRIRTEDFNSKLDSQRSVLLLICSDQIDKLRKLRDDKYQFRYFRFVRLLQLFLLRLYICNLFYIKLKTLFTIIIE